MNSRMIRGIVLGSFSLLVFILCSAPAFAAITTTDLTVWNNTASNNSGAFVRVVYDSVAKTVTVSIMNQNRLNNGNDNDLDKFYWNGTALLTAISSTPNAEGPTFAAGNWGGQGGS